MQVLMKLLITMIKIIIYTHQKAKSHYTERMLRLCHRNVNDTLNSTMHHQLCTISFHILLISQCHHLILHIYVYIYIYGSSSHCIQTIKAKIGYNSYTAQEFYKLRQMPKWLPQQEACSWSVCWPWGVSCPAMQESQGKIWGWTWVVRKSG